MREQQSSKLTNHRHTLWQATPTGSQHQLAGNTNRQHTGNTLQHKNNKSSSKGVPESTACAVFPRRWGGRWWSLVAALAPASGPSDWCALHLMPRSALGGLHARCMVSHYVGNTPLFNTHQWILLIRSEQQIESPKPLHFNSRGACESDNRPHGAGPQINCLHV